jgi:hypothetical protein
MPAINWQDKTKKSAATPNRKPKAETRSFFYLPTGQNNLNRNLLLVLVISSRVAGRNPVNNGKDFSLSLEMTNYHKVCPVECGTRIYQTNDSIGGFSVKSGIINPCATLP